MDNTEKVDYGENSLNELFETLDSKTKEEILTYEKQKQIEILQDIQNPELKNFWNKMSEKEQKKLNKFKLTIKYNVLKTEYKEFLEMKEKLANLKNKETNIPAKEKDDNAEFLEMKEKIARLKNKKSDIQATKTYHYYDEEVQDMKEKISKLKNKEKLKELASIQMNEKYDSDDSDRPDSVRSLHSSDLDMERASLKIFGVEYRNKKEPIKETINTKQKQINFDRLINIFYNVAPYSFDLNLNHELEVKFGTKGIKPLMRNDYDNVIKKLKSSGFTIAGESTGEYYLRINCEFIDNTTGRFKLSDVRTEIKGLHAIQQYCESNDLKTISPILVNYISKRQAFINNKRIFPVDFDEFNFRVAYQTEEKATTAIKNSILENWRKSKKEFRFINRVAFEHPDYPVRVDISITKFGTRSPDRYGRENRGPMIRVYDLDESNVFNNQENYEIEIEIDNSMIGPTTKFNNPKIIVESLRKVIKYVLCGLQGTNFPVSYPEQKEIINSYMKMIWEDEFDEKKPISSKNFIGPNSITLQLKNIAPIDDNSNEPNIRKDFVVTDKADGERHLMYISDEGKVYLINTNMDVIFTGAQTLEKECFNSLIDGELIAHDKYGKFINLYAAFDIYFVKNKDIRNLTFMLKPDGKKEDQKSRYQLLKWFEYNLKLVSIIKIQNNAEQTMRELTSKYNQKELISPISFISKEFFPNSPKDSIFEGCNSILEKEREGRFKYTTDGLIFTHAFYGVGVNEIGKFGPKLKITWDHSFKWKPPQYNTIDFLVTTIKDTHNEDVVKSYYEDGINNIITTQYNEYKTIELRCGFKESKDGFINPCQDVIDDKLPEFAVRYEDKYENDYIPMRFYPTEPYDQNAGLCNIMLRMDGSGGKKMFSEDNQVFEDNTIVEFRYDLDKEEGWKWIPLRVRYDKTAKLRRGEKEYGNAYKVCNENWKSIHPCGRITQEMLSTGNDIPTISISEDIYYNATSGKFKTEAMKNFHNLYVKRKLIVGACKQGDSLIDYACGKAGDLPKWSAAKLSFVFGIDISKDNLENRIDGACARFLKFKKSNKNVPYALFVNGDSAYNIKDGSAMLNDKAKQITAALFGLSQKEPEKIGAGVARQYGKYMSGFSVSSCQFAIHYFFKNPDTLKNFIKNVSECTKHNGYFIGTCYDGNIVFNKLKKTQMGDSIQIVEEGKKIWEITKGYSSDTFKDDSSSLGYKIDVYQESINQTITEYLVNFNYLNRAMSAFGFEIISQEEAMDLGLPNGSGTFRELFLYMLDEISKNRFKAKDYDKAPNMTTYEKDISFLNRYFIYRKKNQVNTETVELEMGEYEEANLILNNKETEHAQDVAQKEVKKLKPKVRKLTKKLMLVAATEAVDESAYITSLKDKNIKDKNIKDKNIKSKNIKSKNIKSKLVIDDSNDSDNSSV
jgi:hypothetical protein